MIAFLHILQVRCRTTKTGAIIGWLLTYCRIPGIDVCLHVSASLQGQSWFMALVHIVVEGQGVLQ